MVETVNEAVLREPSHNASEVRARRRRSQRRELIIAAAEAELSESGLSGITLAAVGERVGLSKGALYYYVDGRDSLLALVLGDALARIQLRARRDLGDDPSALDELAAFAHAHVGFSVERPSGPLVAGSVHELASHEETAELLRQHTDVLLGIVERAVSAGELREVHPRVAASAFFGTLNSVAGTYDVNGPLSVSELVDAALDLLLEGWAQR